jgi:hypothetical protein
LLEEEKLNEVNFIDWYRNLRIVLKKEKTEYVIMESYLNDLPVNATAAYYRAYEKRCDDTLNMSCHMLATMSSDLQKQYEHANAYTMIQVLHGIFENQEMAERYNISKALFVCKLAENSLVSSHVIKILGYIETLDKLGSELKDDLTTNMIL